MSRLDELDVVLRRKDGKVVVGIPSLKLYATAADTAAALDALDAKKRAYQADLEEAGLADIIDLSDHAMMTPKTETKSGELRLFAMKSGVVVGMITVAFILLGSLIAMKVDETIDKTAYTIRTELASIANVRLGGGQFWSKLEAKFDQMADSANDLSAEKQQKLLSNVRTIVNRVRPFAAELAPILSDLQNPDNRKQLKN